MVLRFWEPKERAKEYPLSEVSEITWIPKEKTKAAAHIKCPKDTGLFNEAWEYTRTIIYTLRETLYSQKGERK